MIAVVAAFVALDGWLFAVHGVSQSLRHVLYQPALVFMLLGGVVLATAFHEIGHATGCRYGGARPGVMGVGVYIVWPAFYTDITDAYRLDKRGRLRTDLGGMYFNAVFALAVGALYALTRFEPLLLLIVLQTFAIIQQSLPFLRLDGYYIISDLTGVPDILLRMRPILTSLLPWRKADERVTELKPWVRVVVTAYVLVLVPLIGFMFLMMLINAPRVFATGWDSFWVHWDRVAPDFDHGAAAQASMAILQMVVLVLPALGIVYTTSRVAHRFGTLGWHWSAGDPLRRGGLVAGTVVALAASAFLLVAPRRVPADPAGRARNDPRRGQGARGSPQRAPGADRSARAAAWRGAHGEATAARGTVEGSDADTEPEADADADADADTSVADTCADADRLDAIGSPARRSVRPVAVAAAVAAAARQSAAAGTGAVRSRSLGVEHRQRVGYERHRYHDAAAGNDHHRRLEYDHDHDAHLAMTFQPEPNLKEEE